MKPLSLKNGRKFLRLFYFTPMVHWIKIGLTILLVVLLILLLTIGNGLAANSRVKIPGLSIMLGIGIPIAIRSIWRWKPFKRQAEKTNMESENFEEQK